MVFPIPATISYQDSLTGASIPKVSYLLVKHLLIVKLKVNSVQVKYMILCDTWRKYIVF